MDVAAAYSALRAHVEDAKIRGYEVRNDGTELFGHAPEVGPQAWLHVLFGSLEDVEIVELERRVERPVPDQYKEWLRLANGASLFYDALSLDGLRRRLRRDPLDPQPYPAEIANVHERPPDAPDDAFFAGGYAEDGSLIYLLDSGSAHRCSRNSAQPLLSWSSFAVMLVDEITRLNKA